MSFLFNMITVSFQGLEPLSSLSLISMYPLKLSLRSLRTNFLFSCILLPSSLNSYLSLLFHVFSFQYDYRLILGFSPSRFSLPHQHVSSLILSAELENKFSLLLKHPTPFIFKFLSIPKSISVYYPIQDDGAREGFAMAKTRGVPISTPRMMAKMQERW